MLSYVSKITIHNFNITFHPNQASLATADWYNRHKEKQETTKLQNKLSGEKRTHDHYDGSLPPLGAAIYPVDVVLFAHDYIK
jgi:hypothetical protein